MKHIYSTFVLGFTAISAFGQLVVNQNSGSQNLSQLLAGSGVTISNYSISCATNGTGTFTNSNTNLGVPNGVVLASGRVQEIPNNAGFFASTQFSAQGDAQLSTLTNGTIYDPCILEFDIIPQGSVLKFDYVFASEEYPEWVCSKFNDVFGFFIAGPNPLGGSYNNKNIAIIPGTNSLPVAINTINPGVPGADANGGTCSLPNQTLNYSSLFVDNETPVNPDIAYDGMTQLLTATASVTPCQTYHLKIAIADVADRIYDSGVFLSAYSFTSNTPTVAVSAALDDSLATVAPEGCMGGTFTFTISQPQTTNFTVPLTITGTAANGTDYFFLPDSVVILAGQTSANIHTTVPADSMAEGAETIVVSIVNACSGTVNSSAYITIADNVPAAISVSDSTVCAGQSAQLNASGGTSYSWSPVTGLNNSAISNPIASPATTTTYTCVVTSGACTNTVSQTIYVSNTTISANTYPANALCFADTLTCNATVTSGVAPYTYLWSTGATADSILLTAGGNYSVTGMDSYGCSATASLLVNYPTPLTVNMNSGTSVCANATGTATAVTANTGTAPYNYIWSNGGLNSQMLNGLPPGLIAVTVTDANACSTSAVVNVGLSNNNTDADFIFTGSTCGTNSTISFSHTGTNNVNHFWNFGADTSVLPNPVHTFVTGSFIVTHIVENGFCTDTATQLITISSPPAITVSKSDVTCFGLADGEIYLMVSSGTPAFSYQWSDGVLTQNRTALTSGTYIVTVTDAAVCSDTFSIDISQPVALLVSDTAYDPTCFGFNNGSISFTATGGTSGYQYLWNDGVTLQNRNTLTAGSYTVTVTDANFCSVAKSVNLIQPDSLQLTAVASHVACNGTASGVISLSVSGGSNPFSFVWNDNVNSINRTALIAGHYSVTVTDMNGCSANTSAIITQPAVLTTNLSAQQVACHGTNTGSINSATTGGIAPYSFLWSDGDTGSLRNSLVAGNYFLTVTDANLCSVTATANIGQPMSALAVGLNSSNVNCYGGTNGTISTTVQGGTPAYSYLWNDGATTANRSMLPTGNYRITVTDMLACSAVAGTTILQPANPLTIIGNLQNVSCYGGSNGAINITASGGTGQLSYHWSNQQYTQTISGIVAGTYTVTVSDANSCTAQLVSAITQPDSFFIQLQITNPLCSQISNGNIITSVTGGSSPYNYQWNTGAYTQNISGLAQGTYSVTVSDQHNCTSTASSQLSPQYEVEVAAITSQVSCNSSADGTIQLQVTGGVQPYQYQWSNNSNGSHLQNLTAGTYAVSVSDNNGCSVSLNAIVVTQPLELLANVTGTDIFCAGTATGAVALSISGGTVPYFYNWSNGASHEDINDLDTGTYSVTVTDARGCSITNQVTIHSLAPIITTALTEPLPCLNASGEIDLSVTGGTMPYQYAWSNGETLQDISNVHPGVYSVTVQDANGCMFDTAFTLTNLNTFSVSAFGGGTITLGETIDLHVSTTGSLLTQYFWTPSLGMECATCSQVIVQPGQSTLFTVTGIDTNGCEASDTVSVHVIQDYTIFPPNAFSPNNDGNNDVFQLFGNLSGIKVFEIMIFDRWGEKIFEADHPTFSWDGTYKGEPVGPTVCVYIMKIVFLDGYNENIRKGSVTVLR